MHHPIQNWLISESKRTIIDSVGGVGWQNKFIWLDLGYGGNVWTGALAHKQA